MKRPGFVTRSQGMVSTCWRQLPSSNARRGVRAVSFRWNAIPQKDRWGSGERSTLSDVHSPSIKFTGNGIKIT